MPHVFITAMLAAFSGSASASTTSMLSDFHLGTAVECDQLVHVAGVASQAQTRGVEHERGDRARDRTPPNRLIEG